MLKVLATIVATVLLVTAGVVAVSFASLASGYEIARGGYTYSASREVATFPAGARYTISHGEPTVSSGSSFIRLDQSRLLRMAGRTQVLNGAVAVYPGSGLTDVPAKATLEPVGSGLSYAVRTYASEDVALGLGTIVKVADKRYVVLGDSTLARTGDPTVKPLHPQTLIALDDRGTHTIFDAENVSTVVNSSSVLSIEATGCTFDLTTETLECPEVATIDLAQIMVDPDDDPASTGISRPGPSSSASPTPSPTASADAEPARRGNERPGRAKPSYETTRLPNIDDLPTLPSMPRVTAVARADAGTINVTGVLHDPQRRVSDLRLRVADAAGVPIDETAIGAEIAYSRDGFALGATYGVEVTGNFVDDGGSSQEVSFYRTTVSTDLVKLTAKLSARTSASLDFNLQLENPPQGLSELTVSLKENGRAATVGTHSVDVGELRSGVAHVEFHDLRSNSDYVLALDHYTIGDQSEEGSWYTVGRTLRAMPTLSGLTAVYSRTDHRIHVTPHGLKDPDNAIAQVRYDVYDADEYAALPAEATVRASTTVSGSATESAATLRQTTTMTDGPYLVVATLLANDGQDDVQIRSDPSARFVVDGRQIPSAVFSLKSAGADRLEVNYEVVDPDQTVQLDGSTHPVAQLFAVDANDLPVGTAIGSQDLLTASQTASGVLSFRGLSKLASYKVSIVANYDAGSGSVAGATLGTSAVMRTLDTQTVAAKFSLTDANTESVRITMSLSDTASALSKLLLQAYSDPKFTQPVGSPIDVTPKISDAMTDGTPIEIGSLAPNQTYYLRASQATDSGDNNVPVNGSSTFFTTRRPPQADALALAVKENTVLNAVPQWRGGTFVDQDSAIVKIEYILFASDAPDVAISAKTVAESFSTPVSFNITTIVGAGRGRSYIVSGALTWNDNYQDHTVPLSSIPESVVRSGPSADYQFQSRDASGTSLKVSVADPDNTILDGTLMLDAGGSSYPLTTGENLVVVPGTDAIDFVTRTDYQTLVTDAVVRGAILQTQSVPAYISPSGQPAAGLEFRGGPSLTLVPQIPQSLSSAASYGKYNVTALGDDSPSAAPVRSGPDLSAPIRIPLPSGSLKTGAEIHASVESRIGFKRNGLANQALNGHEVAIGTLDGRAVTITSKGVAVLGASTSATPFIPSGVTIDEKTGDLGSVTLTDALTGRGLGYTSYLGEASTTQFTFAKRADGAYAIRVSGGYITFGASTTTLVAEPSEATPVMLFTFGSATATVLADVTLPVLAPPVVSAEEFSVADVSIQLLVGATDVDSTFVSTDGAIALALNVYDSKSGKVVGSAPATTLGTHTLTVSRLSAGTSYTAKLEGTYNLGDGSGDQHKNYFAQDFTTNKSLPTLSGSKLTWNLGCGANARVTVGSFTYDDPSSVVREIKNVWYERPSGVDIAGMSLPQVTELVSSLNPIAAFSNRPGTSLAMPMYSGTTQNYYAGRTYIVMTLFQTSVDSTPEMLMAANTVTVNAPPTPTTTISVDSLSTKTAHLGFSFTDSRDFFTCDNPHSFKYTLTDSTGVGVQHGEFSLSGSAGSWGPVPFTGLRPSTTYTLTVTTPYDDLRGGGTRTYTVSRSFTTFDDLVASNALTIALSGSTVSTSVTGLQPGKSRIDTLTLQLIRIDDYGTAEQSETVVESRELAPPGTYPATVGDDFSLSTRGLYYTKMIVGYTADATGAPGSYTASSYPINYSGTMGRLDLSIHNNTANISAPADLLLSDTELDVVVTDSDGTVVKKLSASAPALRDGIRVESPRPLAYASVVVAQDGIPVAQAAISNEAQLVFARTSRDGVTLVNSAWAASAEKIRISWYLDGRRASTTVEASAFARGVTIPAGARDYTIHTHETGTKISIRWAMRGSRR
ncbi:hypothetical protein [Leifsonia aquatica]|uniref:hypothetical protein n=1 Tax=Leifsonia aquatica TaxID=144185 RepID=UPI003826F29E